MTTGKASNPPTSLLDWLPLFSLANALCIWSLSAAFTLVKSIAAAPAALRALPAAGAASMRHTVSNSGYLRWNGAGTVEMHESQVSMALQSDVCRAAKYTGGCNVQQEQAKTPGRTETQQGWAKCWGSMSGQYVRAVCHVRGRWTPQQSKSRHSWALM